MIGLTIGVSTTPKEPSQVLGFLIACLPSADGVQRSSMRAAFAVLVTLISALIGESPRDRMQSQHQIFLVIGCEAKNWRGLFTPKASNLGLTAFYKRAVSMRGSSSGLIRGNAPRSISGG